MTTASSATETPPWLWAIITALPFIVGIYSARITHSTARESREASPYDVLARRVTELEQSDRDKTNEIIALRSQVRDLQDTADIDAHYIARLVLHTRHLHEVITTIAPDQPIEPIPER
jgi:hypothetical protein